MSFQISKRIKLTILKIVDVVVVFVDEDAMKVVAVMGLFVSADQIIFRCRKLMFI